MKLGVCKDNAYFLLHLVERQVMYFTFVTWMNYYFFKMTLRFDPDVLVGCYFVSFRNIYYEKAWWLKPNRYKCLKLINISNSTRILLYTFISSFSHRSSWCAQVLAALFWVHAQCTGQLPSTCIIKANICKNLISDGSTWIL